MQYYLQFQSPKGINKNYKSIGKKGIEELAKRIQLSQSSLFNIEQHNLHDFMTCLPKNF